MKRCPLFIAVFMLLSLSFLMELMSQAPYTIQLKSRQFLPPVDQQTVFEAIRQQGISPEATLSGRYHVLLQFYELPDELQKNRLKRLELCFMNTYPIGRFPPPLFQHLLPTLWSIWGFALWGCLNRQTSSHLSCWKAIHGLVQNHPIGWQCMY